MTFFKIKQSVLTLFVIILLTASAFSSICNAQVTFFNFDNNRINIDSAQNAAINKITELGRYDFDIEYVENINDEESNTLFYVFHLTPSGYIVVSANKNLPPIIAYSFLSPFYDKSSDEELLKNILITDVKLRLENIPLLSESLINDRVKLWDNLLSNTNSPTQKISFQQWPSIGNTLYGGWLETQWSQSTPFNNFCPIDKTTGDRSVAGCPAVAMAQILNYHQTINNIEFNDSDDYYHNYEGNNFWIDDDSEEYDFPSFPDLNNHLNNLNNNWRNNNQLTDNDKASINFACGVAAEQVYHPTGSGTFGVEQAFNAYQRFNFKDIELLTESDSDLYDRISSNVINALPVHLAIVNEGWDVGHNLVIDGYNTDGFYHLNFGWGGSYDGWYLLPEDLPYELTIVEGVIVDITDNYSGSKLKGYGNLHWTDVKENSKVKGNFSIENIGISGSKIDWEIVVWPEWGSWEFSPSSGEDLTTEEGPLNINLEVEIPKSIKKQFNGHIKIINKNNLSDYCLIHVLLTTSYNKILIKLPFFNYFWKLIERFNLGING